MLTKTALVVIAMGTLGLFRCLGLSASGDIAASQGNGRWDVEMRMPTEVQASEMVQVEVSLKNLSGEALQADSDCVSTSSLLLLDEHGSTVFNWYDHLIEAQYHGQVPECPPAWKELAPGETLEQTVGFRVDEPGQYTVRVLPPSETVGSTSVPILLSPAVRVLAK